MFQLRPRHMQYPQLPLSIGVFGIFCVISLHKSCDAHDLSPCLLGSKADDGGGRSKAKIMRGGRGKRKIEQTTQSTPGYLYGERGKPQFWGRKTNEHNHSIVLPTSRTRPDTWHKMRLICIHFTFENNTGLTDGRTRPLMEMRRRI